VKDDKNYENRRLWGVFNFAVVINESLQQLSGLDSTKIAIVTNHPYTDFRTYFSLSNLEKSCFYRKKVLREIVIDEQQGLTYLEES